MNQKAPAALQKLHQPELCMASIHRIPHQPAPSRPSKAKRTFLSKKPAPGLGNRLLRAATSGPAKAAYIAIATVGLAAIAVAILGPKRLERQILNPLRRAVGPRTGKLWDQAKPVRDQLASLFHKAGKERETLASDFQSWIGHFRAR
jgi:hypothetical protein